MFLKEQKELLTAEFLQKWWCEPVPGSDGKTCPHFSLSIPKLELHLPAVLSSLVACAHHRCAPLLLWLIQRCLCCVPCAAQKRKGPNTSLRLSDRGCFHKKHPEWSDRVGRDRLQSRGGPSAFFFFPRVRRQPSSDGAASECGLVTHGRRAAFVPDPSTQTTPSPDMQHVSKIVPNRKISVQVPLISAVT